MGLGVRAGKIVNSIVCIHLLLGCEMAQAQVHQCMDEKGEVIFTDQECAKGKAVTRTPGPEINVVPFTGHVDLKPHKMKVLYTGPVSGRASRFVRVSIFEETDAYMIFYIEGYYSGPSSGRAEFRVTPNIHWMANSFSTSERGESRGYARVEPGSKEKDKATSDIITLQLWYYSPQNKASVVETKVIPYKKTWHKK